MFSTLQDGEKHGSWRAEHDDPAGLRPKTVQTLRASNLSPSRFDLVTVPLFDFFAEFLQEPSGSPTALVQKWDDKIGSVKELVKTLKRRPILSAVCSSAFNQICQKNSLCRTASGGDKRKDKVDKSANCPDKWTDEEWNTWCDQVLCRVMLVTLSPLLLWQAAADEGF